MGWKLVSVPERVPEPAPPAVAAPDLKARLMGIIDEVERTFPEADPDFFESFRAGMGKGLEKHADKVAAVHTKAVECFSAPLEEDGIGNLIMFIKSANEICHFELRAILAGMLYFLKRWFDEADKETGRREKRGKVAGCLERCLRILRGETPP